MSDDLFSHNPGLMQDNVHQFSAALHRLGLEMLVVKAGNEREIESAFATAVQQRARAMHIGADAYLSSRSAQVSSLALRYALPTSSESREGVVAGLLLVINLKTAKALGLTIPPTLLQRADRVIE